MTDKKVEPNAVDEFEKWLQAQVNYFEQGESHEAKVRTLDYQICLDKFQSNRPRLKAGMRGVLRFHGKQNFRIINPKYQPDCTVLQPWFTREEASLFAKSLGLTAEFVEVPHG